MIRTTRFAFWGTASGAILAATAANVTAVTINLNFRANGQEFGFGDTEVATIGSASPNTRPASVAGDYTAMNNALQIAMRCAANWWQAAVKDEFTLDINYGWSLNKPVGADALALTFQRAATTGTTPNRTTKAVIQFSANRFDSWFIDATPTGVRPQEAAPDLDFGPWKFEFGDFRANVGVGTAQIASTSRYADMPDAMTSEAANRYDLFSVALHEIGHAMGVDLLVRPVDPMAPSLPITGARAAAAGFTENSVLITFQQPAKPDSGIHFAPLPAHANSALGADIGLGQRLMLSAADILFAAEMSDWRQLDLDPAGHVPEPATGALATIAAAAICGFRSFRRSNHPG